MSNRLRGLTHMPSATPNHALLNFEIQNANTIVAWGLIPLLEFHAKKLLRVCYLLAIEICNERLSPDFDYEICCEFSHDLT